MGAYLIRLASFSSMVNSATRALARSPGDAFWSQTVLDARRPSTQSGKVVLGGLSCAAAEEARARLIRSVCFMAND